MLARPDPPVMFQEPVADGIAVTIEYDDAVGHVDMKSQETFRRDNSLGVKTGKRRLIQENASKDMTGAVSKEDAVRQRPLPMRIPLYALLEDIHRGRSTLIRAEAA
ncbi:hypothetical protein XI06_08310 [Bradyrhizobium sp. CCBAU 11434]|nr:hypothetical protein [Bradyrhizobium sp. CCBAU 11434]